ncbi:hypothetical protein P7C70_g2727, partial [Phenoliferia sp. Uapishka_3]
MLDSTKAMIVAASGDRGCLLTEAKYMTRSEGRQTANFDSIGRFTSAASSKSEQALEDEINDYLGGKHPCEFGGDSLAWWKENERKYPTIARMARWFLPIPASSVGVERLFATAKRVLTNERASMSSQTARMIVCVKMWIKEGVVPTQQSS